MAYIDSSLPRGGRSGLAGAGLGDVDELPRPGEDVPGPGEEAEPEEEDATQPRAKRGGLVRNLLGQIDDINLARWLDDQTLDEIGATVVEEYRIDENSRAEWFDRACKAMKYAKQEAKPKSFPWPNASNVIYPLISQAALEFGARIYPAMIKNRNVVKGTVWGSDTGTPITEDGTPQGKPKMDPQGQPQWLIQPGEKRRRADRVGEHMSYQLLEEMPEWEPQLDQLLHQIPVVGGAARKTFYDPAEGCNASLFVSLSNLVWNYTAPSFEAAPRHTEKLMLYPHEIVELEEANDDGEGGMFLRQEYGPGDAGGGERFGWDETPPNVDASDPSAPHMFIEQHRRLDLDDDGYAEPYVVTVHLRSAKVVRIVARYDVDGVKVSKNRREILKIKPVEHYTLIRFIPSLDEGSYPTGFAELLRPLNEAINTALNQMFDAGTLQNTGGGFISESLSMASGQVNFEVGRYKRVQVKSGNIRDAVFPLDFKGASPTLFQLLGVLMEAGKSIASIQNVLTGDAAMANAPPTTILALIEQGMTMYTAIVKRVFRGLKSEFKKLYALNHKYLVEHKTARYRIGDEWREVTADDYRLAGGVEPIADPTMMTDMQKLAQAQIIASYKGDPMIRQDIIARRLFEAAGVDRIDELFVPPDPMDQQIGQALKQLAVAKAQAELGRERAAELKDQTQAYVNLANARKIAGEAELGFIDQQLTYLRLQIEAANTSVKAAAIDHAFHDTSVRAHIADADRAARHAEASMDPEARAVPPPAQVGQSQLLQPAPSGPFPAGQPSAPAPQPAGGPPPPPADQHEQPGLPPLPNPAPQQQ